MINQINVGIIGTGWCGGIRANACADNPLVDKLYICLLYTSPSPRDRG